MRVTNTNIVRQQHNPGRPVWRYILSLRKESSHPGRSRITHALDGHLTGPDAVQLLALVGGQRGVVAVLGLDLPVQRGQRLLVGACVHGLVVPVFDLDPSVEAGSYGEALAALNKQIEAEYTNDAALTADERKQLDNIKSRQVTI